MILIVYHVELEEGMCGESTTRQIVRQQQQ
jgi:hypothetical protein